MKTFAASILMVFALALGAFAFTGDDCCDGGSCCHKSCCKK